MTDARARCPATESTIGNQRNLVSQSHAGDVARRRKHLLHARPATRTFIANDHHVARLHFSRENPGARVILIFENDAWTFEDKSRTAILFELFTDAGGFDHTALGRELAVENRKPAIGRVRPVFATNAILRFEHE